MAGDWLKFEKATLEKPEVFEMAAILGLDPDAVIGKLLRVWNWFDDQSRDGHASVTVLSLLDRYSGVTGFVDAMQKVGWISKTNDCLILPNFDRHNGSPAKSRALGTKRKQKSRERHGDSVTQSGQKRDKSVTREEKRREENTPLPPKGEWSEFLESVWKSGPILTRTRSSKNQLQSAWRKLSHKPPEAEVLRVLDLWVKSDAWTKDSGQFAPGIHRWIQHRQWENAPEAQPETEGRGW